MAQGLRVVSVSFVFLLLTWLVVHFLPTLGMSGWLEGGAFQNASSMKQWCGSGTGNLYTYFENSCILNWLFWGDLWNTLTRANTLHLWSIRKVLSLLTSFVLSFLAPALYIYVCVCVCVCVWVYICIHAHTLRSQKALSFPGTAIIGYFELPDVGGRSGIWSFASAFNHWAPCVVPSLPL